MTEVTSNTSRRNVLRLVGSAGIASIAGCSSGGGDGGDDGGDESSSKTVEMTDQLTFEPKEIEITAGTTVTWENTGAVGHTVTAYEDKIPNGADFFASGGFDSQQAAEDGYPDEGNVEGGGTYEHTFETTGTYEYYCIPHEMNGMVGTITVVE